VPVTLFGLFAVGLLAYSYYGTAIGTASTVAVFVGGALLFTFFEYWMHRAVFHLTTKTAFQAKWVYNLHGVHHAFPKDKDRLAMPPYISLVVATFFVFVFEGLLGAYGFPLAAGFLVGYALYLLVHYSMHMFKPPHNVFKVLWQNHAMHHYRDPSRGFGVSSPLWDYVFATRPERQRAGSKV
jgi:4-hydroxysphinganine ceramide fatty acyl 2-hydroxylase